jgi:alpha-mannosidase
LLERYVEPLNAMAVAGGGRSALPLIRQAWKNLLQNHPHDSICGCSIDLVHREMMTRFAAVGEIGNAVLDQSLNRILPVDDTATHDDTHLFFFNPSPFTRSSVAKAELRFYLQDIVVGLNPDVGVAPGNPAVTGFALVNAQGEDVPYQMLSRSEGYDITYSMHNYPRQTYADIFSILVDAADIPALGLKGFKIERRFKFEEGVNRSSFVIVKKNSLENELLRVEVNGRGEVTVTDKTNNTCYRNLAVFEDGGDVGDEYNYSYPKKNRIVLSNTKSAKLSIVENGPLRGAIKIVSTLTLPVSATADKKGRSTKTAPVELSTIVSLTTRSRSVEFVTTVNNTVKDHRLRVLFPTGIRTNMCHADEPFYSAERESKKYDLKQFTIEHPAAVASMQRSVTVKVGKTAATLFGYGLPEYELKYNSHGTLALTLLRCVGLLAGDDLITRPGGKGGWHNETPDAQCLGEHTFRYAFFPHNAEGIEATECENEESEEFHLPFLAVRRKNTEPMELGKPFIALSEKAAVLSAVKESEEQDGVIVRWWNPTPEKLTVDVDAPGCTGQAWYAKLNEEPLTPCSLSGIVTKAHALTTLKINL